MQKLFVCNLDRHEIFLPYQQMMWSNCVGWDSMQEIENTLSVSIRRGFNREFGIFKILEGLEKQKSQGAVTGWIFFFFLLQNHTPWAVTQRLLNCRCAHPCAAHSQADDQRVECGIWMQKTSPSLGVCMSTDTSEERHPPPPLQFHALTSHYMNVNHIHPKAKKRCLRNVIFSLLAPFT